MNNDYLRVNSKDEQEGIVEGVYTAKAESKPERNDFAFYSLFGNKKERSIDFKGRFPGVSKALWVFLIFAFASVFLTLVAFFTKSADALMVVTAVASLALPVFAIAVFYGFNDLKNVSYTEILGGLMIGVAYFFVEKIVTDYLAPLTFNYHWIEKFLFTPVFDLGLILICCFYVRCLKKVNLLASVLIVVCVFAGFAFTNAFVKNYGSLFSGVQLVGEERDKSFALVKNAGYFDRAITPFLSAALKYGLYESLLYILWSVIAGGVISLKVSPLKAVYKDSSLYFLIIMALVLHVFENVGSVLPAINVILSVICVSASAVVAYKMLKFVIMKTPREAPENNRE